MWDVSYPGTIAENNWEMLYVGFALVMLIDSLFGLCLHVCCIFQHSLLIVWVLCCSTHNLCSITDHSLYWGGYTQPRFLLSVEGVCVGKSMFRWRVSMQFLPGCCTMPIHVSSINQQVASKNSWGVRISINNPTWTRLHAAIAPWWKRPTLIHRLALMF